MSRRWSLARSAWEAALRALMPNDWPARLAVRLGAETRVVTSRHEIAIQKRLGAASTLKIGFASDLHAGATTPDETIEHAFQALAAERPDLLLLGGDFVAIRARDVERIARRVGSVGASLGTFAVLGNHDYYVGASEVRRGLEAAGVRFLVDESHPLPAPFERVTLVGLDDHVAGTPDGARAFAGTGARPFAGVDAGAVRVLVMHEPSGLLDAYPHSFDLAICGHTHGGQIALPGPIPILAGHGPLSRRYFAGRYDLSDRTTLITSRGVGCTILPFRWNAPAEVVICTLAGTSRE